MICVYYDASEKEYTKWRYNNSASFQEILTERVLSSVANLGICRGSSFQQDNDPNDQRKRTFHKNGFEQIILKF